MEGELDVVHALIMDNFYNRYCLSQLLQRRTHSTEKLHVDPVYLYTPITKIDLSNRFF